MTGLCRYILGGNDQSNSKLSFLDPTAGASTADEAKWVLDETSVRDNLKKVLARFCAPSPLVYVEMNSSYLTSAPPASLEW